MATKQRRASSYLPPYFKTVQNLREYQILDDMLYEPEQAAFIRGYIGSTAPLSQEDLERVPVLTETDASADAYQLSIGSAYVDPVTNQYQYGAFYTDLLNQIAANGGLTNDPNRLFETGFYVWSPPIDVDKHINFSSYFWTGPGDALANGEYVTREIAGSQTIMYRFDGSTMVKVPVRIGIGVPTDIDVPGALYEDASDSERTVYVSTGLAWSPISFSVSESVPTVFDNIVTGEYFYVTRTGSNFQRPLLWMYSESAVRWIALPVVVDKSEPEYPITGMIWEDCRSSNARVFKRFNGSTWIAITYTASTFISGVGADGQFIYDASAQINSDAWASQNWWRHFEDLSKYDRSQLKTQDQAVRPILEFWNGIQLFPETTKDGRNSAPEFSTWHIDPTTYEIVWSSVSSTIMEYKRGSGTVDTVLNIPLSHDEFGSIQFDMTLDQSTAYRGYKYFKDNRTGLLHSTWHQAPGNTTQAKIDQTEFYEVPKALTSNPNHEIPGTVSRSLYLTHMGGVIQSQKDFLGNVYGINSYRWTKRDPVVGATIIDPEHSLLRTMATLQTPYLDIPDNIRSVAREYSRTMYRFTNRLNQLWNQLAMNDGGGTLLVPVVEAVDSVLTMMFQTQTDTSVYSMTGMGTYMETRADQGTTTVVGVAPRPIFIPSSAPRFGLSIPYVPTVYHDLDGNKRLRGHDGSSILSFGDDRDLIWLELQNRFFENIPEARRTETETVSSRHNLFRVYVQDFYGGYLPNLTTPNSVLDIVDDYNDIVSPELGTYMSRLGPVYANWDGVSWGTTTVLVDDMFINEADEKYYIYNGNSVVPIPVFNAGNPDYATNEYRRIIRREFERWTHDNRLDYTANSDFDLDNKFTWNYSSVGVEGNYRGLYLRLYRTHCPHSRPWEIVGYGIEPTWWRTVYPPASIGPDNTPRYPSTHPMWADLKAGLVHKPLNLVRPNMAMLAPVPVDTDGNLLDPISARIITESDLDSTRLDDGWVYGDGGPVEMLFYQSTFYPFAVALAGYLMKPTIFTDRYWIDGYRNIEPERLATGPHLIHVQTLTRPTVGIIPLHMSLRDDGTRVEQHGINEWIAENIARAGLDPVANFSKIIANTNSVLAWKTAGFIDNARTTVTTLGGQDLPFEDVHVVLHKSKPFRSLFASGLTIYREGNGFRVFGYDSTNPNFTIELSARSKIGGEVELREQVTLIKDQHTILLNSISLPRTGRAADTARLAILFGGIPMDSKFYTVTGSKTIQLDASLTVVGGEKLDVVVLTTQSNPSTQIKTFVVGGVLYSYFSEGTGQFEDIPYGTYFDNPNEVINFMMGYGLWLAKQGWIFQNPEPRSGELMDWLYGAKLFARWLQITANPQTIRDNPIEDFDIFYFSPMRYGAQFQSEFGEIMDIESIQSGLYGVLDKNGEPMSTETTTVVKLDGAVQVQPPKTFEVEGDNQIYGCRINLSEVQHVAFMSNRTKFSQIINYPLFSLFYKTMYVDTYRTSGWVGRLEAPGFIVRGGEMLPNFEKQAFDFTRFYSRINPVDDPIKDDQAKNLIGYYPMDSYMDPLLADQRSRFDYYRGMVKAKGTVRAMKAYANGTRVGARNVEFQEDWAWKLGEYGDLRRTLVQFEVQKTSVITPVQVIRFGVKIDPTSQFLEIPDLDRNNLDVNSPWLIPPIPSESGISQMRFPVNPDGTPNLTDFKYITNLFDTKTQANVLSTFLYDPVNGYFDPESMAQVDYVSYFDPALYTTGGKAEYSKGLYWGKEQVGKQWFAPTSTRYFDYHGMLPDYQKASKYWGMPLYFGGTITLTGSTATVTTKDAITGETAPHGLALNKRHYIKVSGADQTEYNQTVYVTAINTTQFTYTINSAPSTPATGKIRVDVSFLWVWEWVESPVPPSQWLTYVASLTDPNAPGGIPQGQTSGDYSYSQITTDNGSGRPQIRYYFWVRSNSAPSVLGREFSSAELESRLSEPLQQGIPWMAPMDASSMLVFMGGQPLTSTSGLEVIVDGRNANTHVEWALVTEGSDINPVSPKIWDKIEDSMSGVDAFGNPVPYLGYTDEEKYGSEFFPPQTVFRDSENGFDLWMGRINTVFTNRDFSTDALLTREFLLSTEYSEANPSGTWVRSSYRLPEYANKTILETVSNVDELYHRLTDGRYREGDLINIKFSTRRDPWTGEQSSKLVRFNGISFDEVGGSNATVQIRSNLFADKEGLRSTFRSVLSLFTKSESNDLLVALFYEVLRQNPVCDWCFKTSYVTAVVHDTFKQNTFVHPNQTEAIYRNILDVKPFRTKLRSETITFSLATAEDVNVVVEEGVTDMIVSMFDRLSSSTFDDGGFDTDGWQMWPYGYDRPLWELADLGRDEWKAISVIAGDGTTTKFDLVPQIDPQLYKVRGIFLQGDTEIDPTITGNTFEITVLNKKLHVEFDLPPRAGFFLRVEMNVGILEGPDQVYSADIEEDFPFIRGDYFHLAARMIAQNRSADVALLSGIDFHDPLGGFPEERVRSEITDSLMIGVTQEYTPAMMGWSGSPWDTTPWDQGPIDIGPRSFFQTAGSQRSFPPGLDFFSTSEDIGVGSTSYVIGQTKCVIVAVYRSTGGPFSLLTPGVDYNPVDLYPNIINLVAPVPGDTIRLVYNNFDVGPLGTFIVISVPSSGYDINGNILTLNAQEINQTITLQYNVARYMDTPLATLCRNEIIADDIMADHLLYDTAGFETNRPVGLVHVNTSNSHHYRWTGTEWDDFGVLGPGTLVYIKRLGQLWQNNSPWERVWETGDTYGLPTLTYPTWGAGVVSGTYQIGQLPDASANFPAAYQIVQHIGKVDGP